MWNQPAFTILFLRSQPKNDNWEWKEKSLNCITQNLTFGLCAALFWFPCHPAYLSCFGGLPIGVSSTVGLGLLLNMEFAERDPSFSLFACLLPINVTRSYVCVSRRQSMPFIVMQLVHKILHLHDAHSWTPPSEWTFSWVVCIKCLPAPFFIKPGW